MLFWNLIRDFFVKYIFGGTYEVDGTEFFVDNALIGYFGNTETGDQLGLNTSSFYLPINGWNDINSDFMHYISLGDWLSTTATIITMVGICIGLFFLVKWFFKIGAGFIGLRG